MKKTWIELTETKKGTFLKVRLPDRLRKRLKKKGLRLGRFLSWITGLGVVLGGAWLTRHPLYMWHPYTFFDSVFSIFSPAALIFFQGINCL